MKMHLTHNENIKTLEDVVCHLDLEEDRLLASKTSVDVYMALSRVVENGTNVNFMVGTRKTVK